MSRPYLDLVRQVLDRQVVDANHNHCGIVDDIEIEPGEKPIVTALMIGNGAASDRLPELARYISRNFFGKGLIRVPWIEVESITEEIKLRRSADELDLDERHGWAYKIISKLPGAWKK